MGDKSNMEELNVERPYRSGWNTHESTTCMGRCVVQLQSRLLINVLKQRICHRNEDKGDIGETYKVNMHVRETRIMH